MPVSPDDKRSWLKPKWLVSGAALAAFALIASYDLRLGLAAGALLGLAGAVWLYLALRYGSLSGAPSDRSVMVDRARQQMSNRRNAATREDTAPASSARD